MIKTQYDADVLIVGGGPSGSLCAYYLAKAGVKVILIDSETFPRDKICGDFVSPVGLNELKKIGIWEIDGFEKTNVITKAAIYVNGNHLVTSELPNLEGLANYGRVIPRLILDNWILESARVQGVEVITSCKFDHFSVEADSVAINCTLDEKSMQFRTKLIIGADGSNSKVAKIKNGKNIKPENKIIAVRAYFENTNCFSEQAELYFANNSFPGYCWFFPTSTTTANVGIGMMIESFPIKETHLKQLLFDTIESDPNFKARIGNGKIVDKITGFPLSIYDPNTSIVSDRVMLVGDAAGLINSINGEGMQYAMLSGRWAAESLVECISVGDFGVNSLKKYETKVQINLGYDMCIANIGMQLIRNRNLNPLWLKFFTIMGTQSKLDLKYADIAGGILAGMIPTSKVLTYYFISRTFFCTLKTSMNGLSVLIKSIRSVVIFSVRIAIQSIKQRKEYWKWIKNVNRSAWEAFRLYRLQ